MKYKYTYGTYYLADKMFRKLQNQKLKPKMYRSALGSYVVECEKHEQKDDSRLIPTRNEAE